PDFPLKGMFDEMIKIGFYRTSQSTDFNQTFLNGFKEFTDDDCTKMQMNRKKLHEVNRLETLIKSLAQANDINVIIDVGSGLGTLVDDNGF
ncbi:hypothetical protein HDV02_000648, partial [Globomyces sp. JEL0801]